MNLIHYTRLIVHSTNQHRYLGTLQRYQETFRRNQKRISYRKTRLMLDVAKARQGFKADKISNFGLVHSEPNLEFHWQILCTSCAQTGTTTWHPFSSPLPMDNFAKIRYITIMSIVIPPLFFFFLSLLTYKQSFLSK